MNKTRRRNKKKQKLRRIFELMTPWTYTALTAGQHKAWSKFNANLFKREQAELERRFRKEVRKGYYDSWLLD